MFQRMKIVPAYILMHKAKLNLQNSQNATILVAVVCNWVGTPKKCTFWIETWLQTYLICKYIIVWVWKKNQLIMIYSALYHLICIPRTALHYDPQYYCYSLGTISTRITPPGSNNFFKDSLMVGQIPVELTGLHWNVEVWKDEYMECIKSLSMCRWD